MRFNSVLVSALLLVSAALAARHDKHRRSRSLDPNDTQPTAGNVVDPNPNLAGAILQMLPGTFDFVTGIVTVPNISGESGDSAIIAVSIDSDETCNDSTIWAGLLLSVDGNTQVFFQWSPGNQYKPNLTISPGDQVQLAINMLGTQTALAMVRNLSNGESAIEQLSSPNAYCGAAVGWGVYTNFGDAVHLADFSTVTFTDASAIGSGDGNIYPPGTGTLYDIEDQTSASTTDSSVIVEYVRGN